MKKTAALLIGAASLTLAGCATPKYNYQAQIVEYKTLPSTDIYITPFGQSVIVSKRVKEHDALYLTQPITITWYDLSRGYYIKEGEDAKADYYYPAGGNEAGRVNKSIIADPWKSIMAPKKGGELCIVTIFHAKICQPAEGLERRKQSIPFEGAYEKNLIYAGAQANKIMFHYQEKINGSSEAVLSKTLEYDLSKSNVIEFGSVKIQVQSATPASIIYQVF